MLNDPYLGKMTPGKAPFSYFIFYKPYMVLSQFTDPVGGKVTLADVLDVPRDVYPVGRLDEDSEGLLMLTNDPSMNKRMLSRGVEKEYWVQVEGAPSDEDVQMLVDGVSIRIKKKDYWVKAVNAGIFQSVPELPARNPPVRFRKTVPDTWIRIILNEGKNRQVRRMTAKIGFPTLRLVRWRFGDWTIEGMQSGELRQIDPGKV